MRNLLRSRNFWTAVAICLLMAVVAFCGIKVISLIEERQTIVYDDEEIIDQAYTVINYKGKEYIERSNLSTILLIGVDAYQEDENYEEEISNHQCDFLLLAVIDKTNKCYTPVLLNRDTMCYVPMLSIVGNGYMGDYYGQLALAHAYGTGSHDSCRNTVTAVSRILADINIDHYVSCTMDAIQTFNDSVGGVNVIIEDDFSDVDETLVQGEEVLLLGDHAVHYIRDRKDIGDNTNQNRMQRHMTYLTSMRSILIDLEKKDSTFILDTITEMNSYLVSDCTTTEMSSIATMLVQYEMKPFITFDGEYVMGDEFLEYNLDEDLKMEKVVNLFFEER